MEGAGYSVGVGIGSVGITEGITGVGFGIVGDNVGTTFVGSGIVDVGVGGTSVEEGAHETTIPTEINANATKNNGYNNLLMNFLRIL